MWSNVAAAAGTCAQDRNGSPDKHGANDDEVRKAEREALKLCLSRFAQMSSHLMQVEERLARLETSTTDAQHKMYDYINSKLHTESEGVSCVEEMKAKVEKLDRENQELFERVGHVSKAAEPLTPRLDDLNRKLDARMARTEQALLELRQAQASAERRQPAAPSRPPEPVTPSRDSADSTRIEVVKLGSQEKTPKPLDSGHGVGDMDQDAEVGAKGLNDETAEAAELDARAYEFGDTVWDAALFIGTRQVSQVDSCFVILLVLLAMLVQVIFVGIVYFVFANKPQFDDGFREQLEVWRINIGHNVRFYDQLTMTSLTERVCNPDDYIAEVSSGTSSIIGQVQEYMGENYMFSGPMLVKVAVLLWSLTVCNEVINAWDCFGGVTLLPRGGTVVMRTEAGKWHWTSTTTRRSAWACFLCFFRIILSGVLWWCGNIFLCSFTISTGDILLNAVALEIVLQVDEALYILVPSKVKRLLKGMEELPAQPNIWKCARNDFRPYFFLLLLVATILTVEFTYIEDVTANAEIANNTLCGGNQGFIYSMDPYYLVYTTETNPTGITGEEIEKYAFREAINETIYPEMMPRHTVEVDGVNLQAPLPMAFEFNVNGLGPVRERAGWSMEESSVALMQSHGAVCEDALHSLSFARRFIVESGHAFDIIDHSVTVNTAVCANVRHLCKSWPLVRAVCPITCECSEPLGTLFLSHPEYGCPRGCMDSPEGQYRLELKGVPCTERTTAQLQTDTTWQAWAKQVGGEIDAVFIKDPELKPHQNSTDMFLTMGCSVIPYWIQEVKREFDMIVDPCVGIWLEEWLSTKPLAAKCPITCGCNKRNTSDEDWFASHCSETCAVAARL